jgi:hypothetical protein
VWPPAHCALDLAGPLSRRFRAALPPSGSEASGRDSGPARRTASRSARGSRAPRSSPSADRAAAWAPGTRGRARRCVQQRSCADTSSRGAGRQARRGHRPQRTTGAPARKPASDRSARPPHPSMQERPRARGSPSVSGAIGAAAASGRSRRPAAASLPTAPRDERRRRPPAASVAVPSKGAGRSAAGRSRLDRLPFRSRGRTR